MRRLQERAKLLLLVLVYALCLITILTSHKGFQLGPRELPLLDPNKGMNRYCKTIWRKAANHKCLLLAQNNEHYSYRPPPTMRQLANRQVVPAENDILTHHLDSQRHLVTASDLSPPKSPNTGSHAAAICPDILQQASTCQMAVQQAFRHVNMGGCSYDILEVTLCVMERCGGYPTTTGHGATTTNAMFTTEMGAGPTGDIVGSAPRRQESEGACRHHCEHAHQALDTCIQTNVQHYLKHYGILP